MFKKQNAFNVKPTPRELVDQFNRLMDQAKNNTNVEDILAKANVLAEEIIEITRQTYEKNCITYKDVRGNKIKEIDDICWKALNRCVERYISSDKSQINILDVGTGNGRDIIYGQGLGYKVIGIDNCDGFIEILSKLCEDGLISEGSFKKCDMRNLDFPNCSFDVVRHNASLLHLPLIGEKYTVDLALSEAHRVLKPRGLLYIFVKKGTTLELHDTKENLGGRIFQFFSHSTLNEVVSRNGFTIVYTSDETEIRDSNSIDWILLIAQKN